MIDDTIFDTIASGDFQTARIRFRGDAPQATILRLSSATTTNPTIFNVRGGVPSGGSSLTRATWFTLEDMTLDGNYKQANWISFAQASAASLNRVQMLNTNGYGIVAQELWDSVFHDVIFDNVGDFRSSVMYPTVKLGSFSGDTAPTTNNIKFEACQFVNNDKSYSVQLDQDTHAIFFLGCSFNGLDTNSSPTIKVNGTSLPVSKYAATCSFEACKFLTTHGSHIDASYAKGLIIANTSFEGSYSNGILLQNCSACMISGSNFGTSTGLPANGSGVTTNKNLGNN
jgi:hypothetical protein